MKKFAKVGANDTLEIGRMFMNDDKMNDFYLELCEKYNRVELVSYVTGETVTAIWHVSGELN